MMKHVFLTTKKYWLKEEGGLLLLFLALAIGTHWLGQSAMAIFPLVLTLFSLPAIYRLLLARIELDGEGISVREKNDVMVVRWSEIIWVKMHESIHKPRIVLELGIRDIEGEGAVQITLDHLDHQRIQELIQQFAQPSALEKDAQQKNSDYQEWADDARKFIEEQKTPLLVSDHWLAKAGSWGLIVLGLVCLFLPLLDKNWKWEGSPYVGLTIWIVLWAGFTALGIFAVINSGTITFDQQAITRKTMRGQHQMRWDEIMHIEEATVSEYFLCSGDRRLKIPTPGWWSGRDKEEAGLFFFTMIDLREIEIRPAKLRFGFWKKDKSG
jgi:hypothetical protein